ncbi:ATP-binding protein [Streptomyces sp. WI04-05B]|uniref:sensor histidine kinase n=1 Tax=Streptomyces TaxID=1883 RepID=UPI0029B14C10|nr:MULTISPECIES: ATP-binding protein [unclassified Streptomyces]MDX2545235.1 ATP-binding protein [Streptomyces sp. WI04-05B]MDX2587349.1 ATP-binding protein [Streptomyces sp. WI04-05A]
MTAPRQPGERPAYRALLPAPLLTAVLAALAVAGAVSRASDEARVPLALGGAGATLLLCVAVTVAAHGLRSARLARRRLTAVSDDAGRLLHDRARLSEELNQVRAGLTADLERERARVSADLVRERVRLHEASAQEFTRLQQAKAHELTLLTEDIARLTEELRRANQERAAALAATANAAGRMQALATSTLADLRAMEDRHTDEDVVADLLHLDHRTAQAGRLADSVAVLSGARSGRRWARPIVMESILRGAMGRISGYQRVRVHSASTAAVAGHAAEGVMHALAELLDNAANFSPPTAEVHLYVEEVPAGIIVSVEDSGLAMSDVQLRRAERAVSGEDGSNDAKGGGRNADGIGLGGLTGTRLGLSVVGRLARKYGLRISFRPSARGGTGVLVLIPQDILAGDAVAAPPLPTMPPTRVTSPVPEAPAAPAPTPGEPWEARSEDEEQGQGQEQWQGQGRHPAVSYAEEGHAEWPYPEEPYADRPSTQGPYAEQPRPRPQEPYAEQAYTEQTYADPSYTAARAAVSDLDPDPVPTHQSPDHAPEHPEQPESLTAEVASDGLPQRRRGRTLAAAERARGAEPADESRFSIPLAPPDPDDTRERVARFGTFRQAVRGTVPDQAALQGSTSPEPPPAPSAAPAQAPSTSAEAAPVPPATSPPTTSHPEGDPTP